MSGDFTVFPKEVVWFGFFFLTLRQKFLLASLHSQIKWVFYGEAKSLDSYPDTLFSGMKCLNKNICFFPKKSNTRCAFWVNLSLLRSCTMWFASDFIPFPYKSDLLCRDDQFYTFRLFSIIILCEISFRPVLSNSQCRLFLDAEFCTMEG